MLNIGVDASRAFVRERTGTENYSYRILKALLELEEAEKYRWVVFVRRGCFSKNRLRNAHSGKSEWVTNLIFSKPYVEVVEVRWSRLWTQGGLALETWKRKLDVLWIPAHTLPVLARPGITKVVTIHGLEYEWLPEYRNKLQKWYLPLSTKYAARVADRIIAVSEFTKKQLIERLKTDANKIKVVHEGVEFEFFGRKRKRNEIEAVKEKYRIGGRYLLFVGSLQPRKNLPFMVQVYAELRKKYTDLQLVLAGGKGWLYEEIFEAPKKFGVEKGVVFPGRVSDEELACLLQGAEVYVQPSITEGFGLPLLEAMAAGCPVVSSDGGALPEVVGEGGIIVGGRGVPFVEIAKYPTRQRRDDKSGLKSVPDLSSWREVLDKLLTNGGLRKELIERGRRRVREFGWERAARKTLEVLIDSVKFKT